ncbi:DUF885 domain-containing protein [Arenibacter latericius]|uniref:DUF885 domain-containing protein n=1 Tax=Arenibacter latericius TaxID=86104 RepID=UPI00040821ED|nr:DUF885 domain-containing protein [Arenibacter latericius]
MNQKISKSLIAFCAIALFISCKEERAKIVTEKEIAEESKKVNDFLQKSFDDRVDRYPEFQTRLGIKKDYGKLNDNSPALEEEILKINKQHLNWLTDSVNVEALSKDVLLSYNLYKQNVENHIADYKYRWHNYPVNQMFGAQADKPAFLINMHRIDDVKDAEAYISRLNGFKKFFFQLVANLKEREAIGVVPPKFVFDKVILDSENILVGQPFDDAIEPSALLKDFLKKIDQLDIDAETRSKLETEAKQTLLNSVEPAYTSLITFMQEQKERANSDHGAWKFPDGEAFYNNALKRTTTTDLTADEIHEIGLSEVARIHGEIEVIKNKVGFEGSLQDFFQFMRTDEQFYYSEDKAGKEAYIKEAVRLIDSMKTRLDEIFITKPKADIMVKAVEPFREKSAGKAFYSRPAADGSRPGIYYANLYDMESMPSYQMEALAYHEGIPGHHMQLAIQQELEEVPMFRKFGGYIAYTEGWGLYSELIPKEMGFYADPYSDFGRLAMELWRACRLVVDTGIHSKKWTREEGIKYYTENTPNAELDAIKMVERHIVMPGQATAYKIGMLKIVELREKAKEALGDKFDIREFHEVVLSQGAIPLNVLEDFVVEYIASKN